MSKHRKLILLSLVLVVAVVAWSFGDAVAKKDAAKKQATTTDVAKYLGKIPASEQKAAAQRAAQKGLKPGVAGLAGNAAMAGPVKPILGAAAPLPGTEGPGGVPHYFGPYGNWAYSPLPEGSRRHGHHRGPEAQGTTTRWSTSTMPMARAQASAPRRTATLGARSAPSLASRLA